MTEREQLSLTLRYRIVEGDWVEARVEELPEVVTVAATREEARVLVVDALYQYLASFTPAERPPLPTVPLDSAIRR